MRVLMMMVMLWVSNSIFAADLPEYSQAYDPARNAFLDFEQALDDARQNQKLVLMELGGDWCRWCHRLDEFYQDNAKTRQQLLDVFVVIKINVSEENWNEGFRKHLPDIIAYPHFFITDSNGYVLGSQNVFDLQDGSSYSRWLFKKFIQQWSGVNRLLLDQAVD